MLIHATFDVDDLKAMIGLKKDAQTTIFNHLKWGQCSLNPVQLSGMSIWFSV